MNTFSDTVTHDTVTPEPAVTSSTDRYQDIADIAKDVRAQLKQEFPTCKFAVTISRYSMGQSMTVSLMVADFEVFSKTDNFRAEKGYAQLNQYTLRHDSPEGAEFKCNGTWLTPKAWAVLKRADEIANTKNWDNSDSQTDYYDVNFAFDIHIGKWNKPVQITGAKEA